MLASRLTTLLPEMTEQEAIETAAINSLVQHRLDYHNWKTPIPLTTSQCLNGGVSWWWHYS